MTTVRVLVLSAAPAGALVSAIIGVTALVAGGALPGTAFASAAAVWWTGDLLGALIVAPLLLAWLTTPASTRSVRGPLEVALLCLGTVLAAELGLGHLLPVPSLLRRLDYLYLLFPFAVWAALRFGSRGASLMTFVDRRGGGVADGYGRRAVQYRQRRRDAVRGRRATSPSSP